jgi:hypothetical protein
MRFGSRFALRDQQDKLRVVRKFLFLPRTFDSEKTRWLEFAWIVEQVQRYCYGEGGAWKWEWVEIGFADEPCSSTVPNLDKLPIYTDTRPDFLNAEAYADAFVGIAGNVSVYKRYVVWQNHPPTPPKGGTGVA